MRHVNRHALVPYSAGDMFKLVDDIPAYPEFLPWCRSAQVLSRDETLVRASLELSRGGMHKWFTTENTLEAGRVIDIRLVDGPFHHLEGRWEFLPLTDDGCKITLDMQFEFAGKMLDMMFGPVFQQISNSLLDAFVKRASAVYGDR